MAQITKLFTKGLDTDTAPHLQEKESYSSAMNVHVAMNGVKGTSDGETSGMEFYNEGGNDGIVQLIDGNTNFSGLFGGFVNEVIVDNPGSNYGPISPSVTFDPPPPGGTQAQGYAVVNPSTNEVTSIVITNPGSGYITAPLITIGPPPGGATATAYCTISNSLVYNKSNIETLGYVVDDTQSVNQKRTIYLFQREYDPLDISYTLNSFISKVVIDYDIAAKRNLPVSYSTVLDGQWVEATNLTNDGLDFKYQTFVSGRISNKLLIWTDGTNTSLRYVDVTKDYSVYNPNLLTQEELSLITEPGHVPLVTSRGTDPTKSTLIQSKGLQFSYRITNVDDFFSVLSPYSLTSLPPHLEEIAANNYYHNIITISLSKEQKIPDNWQTIEFVSRDVETNVFQVIRKFDKDDLTLREYDFGLGPVYYTDAQLVNEHNTSPFLIPYITFQNWDGSDVLTTLGTDYTSKQFDAVPLSVQSIELSANRLLAANIVEGYDTPNTNIEFASAPTFDNPVVTTRSASLGLTPYILFIKMAGGTKFAWGVFTIYNGHYYQYPLDCSVGTIDTTYTFNANSIGELNATSQLLTVNTSYMNLPQETSVENMIQRTATPGAPPPAISQYCVDAAVTSPRDEWSALMSASNPEYNGTWESYSNVLTFAQMFWMPYEQLVTSGPGAPGVFPNNIYLKSDWIAGINRAFFPGTSYSYGVDFYDSALRKCGVAKIGASDVPEYFPDTRTLYQSISFDVNTTQLTGAIPDWAKYYAITFSKNNKAFSFISFVPGIIKTARISALGEIKINNVWADKSLKYYGIAIPLSSLLADGVGYGFKDGDVCKLAFYNNLTPNQNVINGQILTTFAGYAIINVDESIIAPYLSEQYNQLSVVSGGGGTGYCGYGSGLLNSAQSACIATIYTPQTTTNTQYEIAAFGTVDNLTTLGDFFNSGATQTFTLNGDTYTQSRDSDGGAYTCVSMNPYEKKFTLWLDDLGRVAPVDNVGQRLLTNTIRWSNVRIPQTKVNGLSSFDALNAVEVEGTAGPITTILQTSKEANQGGRLLILCNSGSFVSLVGQSQVYSADSTTALTTTASVLGTILPLTQNWGCISPASVVGYKGLVFWADALNREIIAFSGSDAEPISQNKAGFLWNQVFRNLPFEKEYNNSARYIKGGINPYTFEAFFTCPNPNITQKVYPGNCGINGINQYIGNENVSYIYNWKDKNWQGAYQSNPDYWVRVGDDVYTFGTQYGGNYKMLKEFDNSPGIYNQLTELKAYITFPVVPQYPSTIEPLAMMILNQGNVDNAIIYARDSSSITNNNLTQITKVSGFTLREGELFSSVYRNRLSNNSENALVPATAYEEQNFNGDRIRTKSAWVQVNLFEDGDPSVNNQINLQSVKLEVKESSGH
jgi:hypothetical protein